jgi:hypothetical protein
VLLHVKSNLKKPLPQFFQIFETLSWPPLPSPLPFPRNPQPPAPSGPTAVIPAYRHPVPYRHPHPPIPPPLPADTPNPGTHHPRGGPSLTAPSGSGTLRPAPRQPLKCRTLRSRRCPPFPHSPSLYVTFTPYRSNTAYIVLKPEYSVRRRHPWRLLTCTGDSRGRPCPYPSVPRACHAFPFGNKFPVKKWKQPGPALRGSLRPPPAPSPQTPLPRTPQLRYRIQAGGRGPLRGASASSALPLRAGPGLKRFSNKFS